VTDVARDHWAEWLLQRRSGGDAERHRRMVDELAEVRDRVLENASLRADDVVLDVGAGDGLIAFGALQRLGGGGRVVFADISADLLEHCRSLAEEFGVIGRCRFVLASADDLQAITDDSVDVVTTRSVLIYLERDGKRRAFEEFRRVLRAGGRLSIFEPINSFGYPYPEGMFCGYDLSAIPDLVAKVLAASSPAEERTLIDFDERDLLDWAEGAGFDSIRLAYEAEIQAGSWLEGPWEVVLRTSGNPLAPTLGEALEQALTPAEQAEFEAHLRPLVEADAGRARRANAFLSATKP
jgi:ubiquinone/menaquinone biosynthesis C-methylase UbiE